jgi:hypothetical protein
MSNKKIVNNSDPLPLFHSGKNRLLFVLVFTPIHMLLTYVFFYLNYSSLLRNMETGSSLTWTGQLLIFLSDLFQWPLIRYLSQSEFVIKTLPSYSFYIVLFLNSLLWALVVLGIILLLRSLWMRNRKNRSAKK